MVEKLRSLLSLPSAYSLFWRLIGGPSRSMILVKEYVRLRPEDRVLEIGCGPGTIVPYLAAAEYVGFDASLEYIQAARAKFGDFATFVCGRVSEYSLRQLSYFDVVLALGIVHHLDDAEASQLFQIAHSALKPGGRLITLDGCFTEGQSAFARYLLTKDRGQYVRSREGYLRIASEVFTDIKASIRPDPLHVPYTHLILECTR